MKYHQKSIDPVLYKISKLNFEISKLYPESKSIQKSNFDIFLEEIAQKLGHKEQYWLFESYIQKAQKQTGLDINLLKAFFKYHSTELSEVNVLQTSIDLLNNLKTHREDMASAINHTTNDTAITNKIIEEYFSKAPQ